MKEFIVTVRHDGGTVKLKTIAANEGAAVGMVMKAERCPFNAIKDVTEVLKGLQPEYIIEIGDKHGRLYQIIHGADKYNFQLGGYYHWGLPLKEAMKKAEAIMITVLTNHVKYKFRKLNLEIRKQLNQKP